MKDPKRMVSALRETAPYLGLGIQLAVAVLVFYYVGAWADRKFDTAPWLMVVCVMIGVAGGIFQFFRTVADLAKKESPKMPEKPA